MGKSSLKFLHLSDIHFKKQESMTFEDVRVKLEQDAELLVKEMGSIQGILITGDIAFSGAPAEYEIALGWIDRLCGILGCSTENVWSIPGNHDVERAVIRGNRAIRTIQQDIRNSGPNQLDFCLEDYFKNSDACDLLYQSTKNYVKEFASKYKCEISAAKPYIQQDFKLNDDSILRVRGINSTLASNEDDDDGKNKLAVGTLQSTLVDGGSGIEYLLMCHHPYPWLIDQDKRKDHWTARARIQLFGHKHRARLERSGNSIIISAGAMQPSQDESDWAPRYNGIEVSVSKDGEQRYLDINVFRRIWNEEHQRFIPEFTPEGSPKYEERLKLRNWTNEEKVEEVATAVEIIEIPKEDISEAEMTIEDQNTISNATASLISPRRLTHRFLRLPYHVRIKIVTELNLQRDEDTSLQDESLLFPRYFRRAAEADKVRELWDAVEVEYLKLNQDTDGTK